MAKIRNPKATCGTCELWKRSTMQCRRFPAPDCVTSDGYWCGEHQDFWVEEEDPLGPQDGWDQEVWDVLPWCCVRTVNCFRMAGIRTIGELVQWRPDRLLKLRNFGRKGLRELEEVMEEEGFRLGTVLPAKYPVAPGESGD